MPDKMPQNQEPVSSQPIPSGQPGMIPQKPSSALKNYLTWARSQGVTPTFTNIPNQTGQFATGPGGQAHMVQDQVPGAIPGREQAAAPKMSDPKNYTDPWDYADKNKEHILPALWERLFPGRPYKSALTAKEKGAWRKAANSQLDVLIQKGKWILGDKGPRKSGTRLTLKERADYLNQFRKEYNEMLTKPPGTTPMSYAMARLREIESSLYGDQDRQAQAPSQGPQAPGQGMPASAQEFRQVIQLLKRQFNNDEAKVRQALKQRYPNLPI